MKKKLGDDIAFEHTDLSADEFAKKCGNFLLEGWTPTPVEQALMNGTFDKLLNESVDTNADDISSDFLEVQDFDTAMEEIKSEIDKWQSEE